MGLFSKKAMGGGLMDVIRCDEPSYLIWKWHPEGEILGNNRKENAIRWGSSIRVKDGEVAVFMHNSNGATTTDYIVGPFDGLLETSNLPIISNIIGLAYAGGSPFQAEVYFINLAYLIQSKFVVPYFDVFEPKYERFGVPVAVRGTMNLQISDYEEFIKIHRLINFTLDDFKRQIQDAVTRYVKSIVANVPEDANIPVVQMERQIDAISELVEAGVGQRLHKEFGVTLTSLDIADIDIDKTSEGYEQLIRVTRDVDADIIEAKRAAAVEDIRASRKINTFEKAGKAFSNVKDNVFGKKIKEYNVVEDGEAVGPFDLSTMQELISSGRFNGDSLVWTEGMPDWKAAKDVADFKGMFTSKMPPIPNSSKMPPIPQ